jgi:hypothetical protein
MSSLNIAGVTFNSAGLSLSTIAAGGAFQNAATMRYLSDDEDHKSRRTVRQVSRY